MIPAAHALRAVAGAQAVVHRAQEPCHGPGGRPGPRLVLRPQRHAEEELPVRIFLAHHPAARSRACSPSGTTQLTGEALFAGHIPQSRLPLRALLRRAPACRTPLSVQAQPPPAQHPHLPRPGRRQPSLLLLQRRHPQGRGGRRDLPLHRLLEAPARQLAAPPRLRLQAHHLPRPRPARSQPASPSSPCVGARQACSPKSSDLPPSAWRTVTLDVPNRKYRTPRVFEQKARPRERTFRQLFITDLGHDEPTILLTNDANSTADNHHRPLCQAHAHRERPLRRRALLPHRRALLIGRLQGRLRHGAPRPRQRPLSPASPAACAATTTPRRARSSATSSTCRPTSPSPTSEITVRFHRRAHLPIVLASGLIDKPVAVPWWNGRPPPLRPITPSPSLQC